MRKKTQPSVATPDITKAWGAFFEEVAVCDAKELKKQGWMTNAEISELSKLEGEAGRQLADGAEDELLQAEGKIKSRFTRTGIRRAGL